MICALLWWFAWFARSRCLTSLWRFAWFARSGAHVTLARVWWLVGRFADWLTGCLAGWLARLAGWLAGWADWLAGWLGKSDQKTRKLKLPSNLQKISLENLFGSKIFISEIRSQKYPLGSWSWAWFFWRPLQEGNFEIFLATPQLDPNRKPIWFCNCKLKYTVWDIWESQLVHIQFSAILKQLFGSLPFPSLPSLRPVC